MRGITRAFKKHLDLPRARATPARETAKRAAGNRRFGVVGYIAKGIAIGGRPACSSSSRRSQHDPETAGGLDAALHTLAGLPFGPVILWIVGAGLVIYGLFCFARARYAGCDPRMPLITAAPTECG